RGWTLGPDGAAEPLMASRKDVLAGTVNALAALAGDAEQAALTFTGGEWLGGRAVIRLDTRDAAGRRRCLYLDPETYALAGLAYPEEKGEWVEEVHAPDTITRLDLETGALRERAGVKVEAAKQD